MKTDTEDGGRPPFLKADQKFLWQPPYTTRGWPNVSRATGHAPCARMRACLLTSGQLLGGHVEELHRPREQHERHLGRCSRDVLGGDLPGTARFGSMSPTNCVSRMW